MIWEEQAEVIIGNYGEDIVTRGLEECGLLVYRTNTNGSHPIDLICFNKNDELFFCEVKTKPRRYCCDDTGVDLHSFKRYINLIENYKQTILLYFVDEYEEAVYYINLNKIIKKSRFHTDRKSKKPICYFFLEDMKLAKRLKIEELNKLKELRLDLKHPIPDLNKYNGIKFFKK